MVSCINYNPTYMPEASVLQLLKKKDEGNIYELNRHVKEIIHVKTKSYKKVVHAWRKPRNNLEQNTF